jgi:hypothetical protein
VDLFLDTTIQHERALAGLLRRRELAVQLQGTRLWTSSYVWMEFRRTVLQTTAYLQQVVREMTEAGASEIAFGELSRRLTQDPRLRFRPRARERAWEVYAGLVDAFAETYVPAGQLMDALGQMLEWRFPRRFFAGIDHYLTTTDCDLARPEVLVGDQIHTRLSCHARRAHCALVSHLERHRKELQALAEAMRGAAEEDYDPATQRALQNILEDPRRALGERTCWPLGDIIIALEIPPQVALFTTDHHFDLLCRVLGKARFLPQTSTGPGLTVSGGEDQG